MSPTAARAARWLLLLLGGFILFIVLDDFYDTYVHGSLEQPPVVELRAAKSEEATSNIETGVRADLLRVAARVDDFERRKAKMRRVQFDASRAQMGAATTSSTAERHVHRHENIIDAPQPAPSRSLSCNRTRLVCDALDARRKAIKRSEGGWANVPFTLCKHCDFWQPPELDHAPALLPTGQQQQRRQRPTTAWFMCVGKPTTDAQGAYMEMVQAALLSARLHAPSLAPHVLYVPPSRASVLTQSAPAAALTTVSRCALFSLQRVPHSSLCVVCVHCVGTCICRSRRLPSRVALTRTH